MEQTILNSMEDLMDLRYESQMYVYEAIGQQLLKEFFIDQVHQQVYQEAEWKDPLKGDDKVPTLTKIADWFRRLITKLRARHVSKKINKLIESIRDSDRYNRNEEYEVLLPEPEWINTKFNAIVAVFNSNATDILIGRDDISARALVSQYKKFASFLRRFNRIKFEIKEVWDEIKGFSAINDTITKRKGHSKNKIDGFLSYCENVEKVFSPKIDEAFHSIDNVKRICEEMINNDIYQTGDMKKFKEQYVKFITDYTTSLMYVAQMLEVILTRIKHSIGAVHDKTGSNGV